MVDAIVRVIEDDYIGKRKLLHRLTVTEATAILEILQAASDRLDKEKKKKLDEKKREEKVPAEEKSAKKKKGGDDVDVV